MNSKVVLRAYLLGLLSWALSLFLALKFGAVDELDVEVIFQLRMPRAILASAIGMGLAVAGAALQALFANPLCEPYTMGISSGSALGAVLGITLGLNWTFAGLTGTAFLGALCFASILYFLSLSIARENLTLLLAGVMLGFLGSSLVALWMAMADANGIQGAMFWLLGDLSRARVFGSSVAFVFVAVLSFAVWTQWRSLDALLMGEEGALALGISVTRVRRRIILLTSLLVGACVSAGGMIGFIGLVVPHFVRHLVGSLHFRLIPLAAIWGATALTLADVLARMLARPYEVPVGVVTALIGAPLFLWVMLKRRRIV